MPFEIEVYTREQWQRKRDDPKYDVPKGAAKVSMGDALAKFHKEAAKGFDQGEAEAKKLKKTIEDYKKEVKKKHPKFVTDVVEKLAHDLAKYTAYLDDRKSAAEKIRNGYNLIRGVWPGLKGRFQEWKAAKEKGEVEAEAKFEDKGIKSLRVGLQQAGNAARTLAFEDANWDKMGKEWGRMGAGLEADTLSEKWIEIIDRILNEHGERAATV